MSERAKSIIRNNKMLNHSETRNGVRPADGYRLPSWPCFDYAVVYENDEKQKAIRGWIQTYFMR